MLLAPTTVSRNPYAAYGHRPVILRRYDKQVLQRRWNNSIADGTLDSVHMAINNLAQHASRVYTAETYVEMEGALSDLVGLLPYAMFSIQKMISFYGNERRFVLPLFEVNDVIEASVSQFLPAYSAKISQAIWNFETNAFVNSLNEQKLTKLEREYRSWSTSKLITSLVLDAV
jgi:hypothetical protein